ncbi:MAG: ABC transporter substrate-binding protein [Actinomycetota bacterium]
MTRRRRQLSALLLTFGLLATACGDSDDDAESTASDADATETTAADSGPSDGCDNAELPLDTPGQLTVATGEPVFEPWMVDDDPTNQQGFESALVYALADRLGFAAENVAWVRTGFDEAIAPGDKPYDFNIQQYSITEDREEVVDFSVGYYQVEQAVIGAADSPVASAATIADLADTNLGAAIGTTSLDYVENVIGVEAAVYDDNVAAKAAFDAGQVDGIVFDLPTAYFITAVEIPEADIIGVLPRVGDTPEELGLLFEDGSPLVSCVDEALEAMQADGTIDGLEDEWLNQGGGIPSISE